MIEYGKNLTERKRFNNVVETMEISRHSSDQRRTMNTVRRQPPSSGQRSAWNRPKFWFRFIIGMFSINLFIAFVTIERHISSVSTVTKASSSVEMIDRPMTLSSRWRQEQQNAQFSTESRIWNRMLLQKQGQEKDHTNSYSSCKNRRNQTAIIAKSKVRVAQNPNGVRRLPPFGFPDAVHAYVQEQEGKKGEALSQSPTYCIAPPLESACKSLQYTVVIYFGGIYWDDDGIFRDSNSSTAIDSQWQKRLNTYWRNVVVRTMKYLAYSSVQRVNLVLREKGLQSTVDSVSSRNISADSRPRINALGNSAHRNKYAKRVLNWSQESIVNVVSTASLWDAIGRLEVPSEGILWIDGDLHTNHSRDQNSDNKTINDAVASSGTMLKRRFLIWREAPNALVISKVNGIIPIPLSQSNDHNDETTPPSMCSLPLLHELMMHRNYLCYLNHPIVGLELRNYTGSMRRWIENSDRTHKSDRYERVPWEVTNIAMGMILFSIGEGYIIEDNDLFADGDNRPFFPFNLAASDYDTFAASAVEISSYLGCPCSMATPRLLPSNARKCISGQRSL